MLKKTTYNKKATKTFGILLLFSYLCNVQRDKEIFKIMKTSEFLKILRGNNCFLEKHGSRHDKWRNRETGEFEWVPRHTAEVPNGLAQKILKKLVGE